MACSDRLPEGLPKELPRDLPSIEKKVITATILNPYVNLRGINLDKITNVYGRRYLIEGSNPSFPEREIFIGEINKSCFCCFCGACTIKRFSASN